MKLKFRSSLNKFNPFDSQSDAKPIDLSLKSRIKNFMKKSSCDEFKTSSSSINSISSSSTNSINSISPTNSLNRQYDAPCRTPINVLGSLHSVPPSPPNSVEEDEEESAYIQQRQLYYNHLLQKQYENQQLNLTLTNLLSASHLSKSNGLSDNQLPPQTAANLAVHHASSRKPEPHCPTDEKLAKRVPSSLNQSAVSNGQQHIHYQKQMVIKHASQMSKRTLQNHYDPYSQAAKRKCGKANFDEDEEPDDYYDSAKLLSKLKVKYCNPKSHSVHINPPRNDQLNQRRSSVLHQIPGSQDSPTGYSVRTGYYKDSLANSYIQSKPLSNSISANVLPNSSHLPAIDPIFLQKFCKEYYAYLLSQSGADGKLSTLQIIMKNILEQKSGDCLQFGEEHFIQNRPFCNQLNLLNQQFKSSSTSIETHSLASSTPSPNGQQANFYMLQNEVNDSYLPSTPPSLKDGQTNETSTPTNPEERKRSSRPLTGRHVRQGTGASPTTLANLKMAIKERQKFSSFRPIKRKGK